MLILPSALLSAGSGKVGGVVMARNAGGDYLRRWVKPPDPGSALQLLERTYMGQLQAQFAGLSAAVRTAWATFAAQMPITNRLGATIHISGQNWFIKCNSLRLQAGVAAITAAPTIFESVALTLPVPTVTASSTTCSLAFTNTDAWATEAGGYLLVFAGLPLNPTRGYYGGPYRYCGKVTGATPTAPTTPQSITLPWTAGAAGSKMGFRFIAIRADGRVSMPFRILCTV